MACGHFRHAAPPNRTCGPSCATGRSSLLWWRCDGRTSSTSRPCLSIVIAPSLHRRSDNWWERTSGNAASHSEHRLPQAVEVELGVPRPTPVHISPDQLHCAHFGSEQPNREIQMRIRMVYLDGFDHCSVGQHDSIARSWCTVGYRLLHEVVKQRQCPLRSNPLASSSGRPSSCSPIVYAYGRRSSSTYLIAQPCARTLASRPSRSPSAVPPGLSHFQHMLSCLSVALEASRGGTTTS